jgi:tRNA U34 5-carboxymethylaminomethyl modifying enzyme MnmG/GidA
LLALEEREKLVYEGMSILKQFKLPVNEWIEEDKSNTIGFQNSKESKQTQVEPKFTSPNRREIRTSKVLSEKEINEIKLFKNQKGGIRNKSALDIMSMPNMTLDIVEDIMVKYEMLIQTENENENDDDDDVYDEASNINNEEDEDIDQFVEENKRDIGNEKNNIKNKNKEKYQFHNLKRVRKQENSNEMKSKYKKIEGTPDFMRATLESMAKYNNYLERQVKEIEHWRRHQDMLISSDIVYSRDNFPNFKTEEIEKLNQFRPTTFHEAGKISGLSSHSLVYLYNYCTKNNKRSLKK